MFIYFKDYNFLPRSFKNSSLNNHILVIYAIQMCVFFSQNTAWRLFQLCQLCANNTFKGFLFQMLQLVKCTSCSYPFSQTTNYFGLPLIFLIYFIIYFLLGTDRTQKDLKGGDRIYIHKRRLKLLNYTNISVVYFMYNFTKKCTYNQSQNVNLFYCCIFALCYIISVKLSK